jgi:hypothetical protein
MVLDFTTEFASDFDEIVEDFGQTMTYLGVSYDVSFGAISDARVLEIDGLMDDGETAGAFIKLSDFEGVTTPTIGGLVTIEGKIYRVARHVDSPDGLHRQLILTEASR